jgi:type I restriction enzyme, R subunit
MNKIQTCTEHIDPALKTAGWGVVEGSRIRRDYLIAPGRIDIMGRAGRGFVVDYVLEYRNTRLAASVALAWSQDLAEGVAQAKHHAAKLGVRYAYSTNGRGIHGIDLQTGHEAPLSA